MKTKKIRENLWIAWTHKLPLYNIGKAYGATQMGAVSNLDQHLEYKKQLFENFKQ